MKLYALRWDNKWWYLDNFNVPHLTDKWWERTLFTTDQLKEIKEQKIICEEEFERSKVVTITRKVVPKKW